MAVHDRIRLTRGLAPFEAPPLRGRFCVSAQVEGRIVRRQAPDRSPPFPRPKDGETPRSAAMTQERPNRALNPSPHTHAGTLVTP